MPVGRRKRWWRTILPGNTLSGRDLVRRADAGGKLSGGVRRSQVGPLACQACRGEQPFAAPWPCSHETYARTLGGYRMKPNLGLRRLGSRMAVDLPAAD